MKKLILLIGLLPSFIYANPLDELLLVNKQWKNNQDGISYVEKVKQLPDENLIISHLIIVEKVLRNRSVDHLTATQKRNRVYYLDILKKYIETGTVPTNDYIAITTPVFIDRKGVHCAVGYLLQQGGYESVARKIDNLQKFSHVHDITVPELLEWQKQSGLSLDELAWIQPGYPYRANASALGEGLPGNVMDIKACTGKYSLLAGGNFKIKNDSSVLLAGWDGKTWNTIIAGKGIINKIEINSNIVISYGGNITFGNYTNSSVIETDLSNTIPTHKVVGALQGEITDYDTYKGKKYVCGKIKGGLAVWMDPDWITLPNIPMDTISSIRVFENKLFMAGNERLMSYDGTKYIFEKDLPKHSQISYIQVFKKKLFIGLRSKEWTTELLYTLNGTTLEKFDSIRCFYGKEISNIIVSDNKILVTGDLSKSDCGAIPYYGMGLALYNSEFPDSVNPIIYVNNSINSAIIGSDGKIIIAGNFTHYLSKGSGLQKPLMGCGIAYEYERPEIIAPIIIPPVQNPFPNPIVNIATFPMAGKLIDINGKIVLEIEEGENNLEDIRPGIYIYVTDKAISRIIKQ